MEKNLNFDEVVERKGTGSLKYDFAVKRGKPADILPLWVADMDFRTSSYITEALSERALNGIFGYTDPDDEYFSLVNDWFESHHGLHIDARHVVVTPGVVYALSQAVLALTAENENVIILSPVYYPFYGVIRDNKRNVIESELVTDEDGKYLIDFDDFENKIKTNNVRMFILCNPHNPGGRVYTKDELRKLGDICKRHDVIVVSDEIHADFVFEGHKHIPFTNVDESFKDFSVIATSPSKTFNLAGLQVSNIIIQNDSLRRKFKRQVWASGYSQANTLGLTATKAAYRDGNEWYEAVKKYIYENVRFTENYLKENLPELKMIEPEGTYLVWIDCKGLGMSARELDEFVIKEAGLWLDDGAIFGKTGEGYERINVACPRSILQLALDKLKSAYEKRKTS